MRARLHKGQLDVAEDNHRFKVINAGRRWGKSVLSAFIILGWAIEDPGVYWIVNPTYGQGKDIHWNTLKKIIPRKWIAKINEDGSIELTNGSLIQLRSADIPDRLRGVGLKGIIIDEIATIRDWDYLWEEAVRPALSDHQGKAVFISTPRGFNHFWDLYEKGLSTDPAYKEYKSWHFKSESNPYFPKEELEVARKELSKMAYEQEYEAKFASHVGLVYPEFDRNFHIVDMPDFVPKYWIRGLDRGYTHPTAVPIIAVDNDDNWYQVDELYRTKLTNPELARELAALTNKHKIKEYELSTMDSAQKSDIVELGDSLDQDFVGVIKESGEPNQNYVLWKIQKFAERLKIDDHKKAKFYVHPRCKNTIKEFELYEWREKTERADPDAPLKLNDHMMDALADLNGMYLHMYEKKKSPYADKIPGTYIEPAIKPDDENDWTSEAQEDPYYE